MAVLKRNYVPGESEVITQVEAGTVVSGEYQYFSLEGYFKFEIADPVIYATALKTLVDPADYDLLVDSKYTTLEAGYSTKSLNAQIRFTNPAYDGEPFFVSGLNFGTMVDNEEMKRYVDELPHPVAKWLETLTVNPDANSANVEVKLDSFNKGTEDRLLSVTNSDTGEVLGSIRGDGKILFLLATIAEITAGDIHCLNGTVEGTLDVLSKISAGSPTETDATINVAAPSVSGDPYYVIDSDDIGDWADGTYTEVIGSTILGEKYYENDTSDKWFRAVASFAGGPAYGWAILATIDPNFEWQTGDGFYQSTPNVGDFPQFLTSTFVGGGALGGSAADVSYQTGIVADKAIRVEGNIHLDGSIKSQDGTVRMEILQETDDEGISIRGGQFSVGDVSDPRESVFGSGDSYPVPIAFHCDESNTVGLTITGATDVTTILETDTGSSVGLFGGIASGKYILIGSDYPFQGVKVKYNTFGSVDPSNVRLESWRGDNDYFKTEYVVTNSSGYPRSQYANNMNNSLTEHWRFGYNPLVPSSWMPITLNINGLNITKYWGRFVVETGIVSDPIIEQIKLHTDRVEIDHLGQEFFGFARPGRTLQGGLHVTTPNAFIDPANENVLYGSGVTAKYQDNEFASNADDGFLLVQGIDVGLDTGMPIILSLSYYVKGAGTGDVVFDIDVFQVDDGFVYDGNAVSDQYSVGDTVVASSNLVRRSVKVLINAEKVIPGEALLISIKRNSVTNPADTLNANIVNTFVALAGYFWK